MKSAADPRLLQSRSRVWTHFGLYALMLLCAAGLFQWIRSAGERLSTQVSATPITLSSPQLPSAKQETLPHVLLALLAIIVTGRGVGYLVQRWGQPRVIGEVIAGILLGPSLLGRISPDAMRFILPVEITPLLGIIAQLGVILYMFLVGLDLNADHFRSRTHSTILISHASIIVPFLLGGALSLWLFRSLAPDQISFTSFALFMGVAMSITAFPVLARILTDRRMEQTPLGTMALGCAAADDVTAWCLLAFVVGITQANISSAFATITLTAVYIAAVFWIVRPVVRLWLSSMDESRISTGLITWVISALIVSALVTEAIGIHAIFGAFLLGAMIPRDSAAARVIRHKLEEIVTVLFLPAFFALTGMKTQIGLLNGLFEWGVCGVIIAVATLGKFGGTMIASRLSGLDWRMSASLGILMNTRGLMELIVLNIGLDQGVISPKLFAMMVLMAIATTVMTSPVLNWIDRIGTRVHSPETTA